MGNNQDFVIKGDVLKRCKGYDSDDPGGRQEDRRERLRVQRPDLRDHPGEHHGH